MDEQLTEKINEFIDVIQNNNHIVFFGGAGVSTESGIPDFRGTDGIYYQKYDFPPEQILSDYFFWNSTAEFYRFYRDKMIFNNVKPNVTHLTLSKLEQLGKLDAVVTQNIDDLHEQAGSKNVYHLHGSIFENRCSRCGKSYEIEKILNEKPIPHCSCGGIIKPDVVLYGEPLPENIVEKSINAIKNANVLIIGGTSLTVYPAAMYVNYFKGDKMILINKQSTPMDEKADLIFHCSLGEVFTPLLKKLNGK